MTWKRIRYERAVLFGREANHLTLSLLVSSQK